MFVDSAGIFNGHLSRPICWSTPVSAARLERFGRNLMVFSKARWALKFIYLVAYHELINIFAIETSNAETVELKMIFLVFYSYPLATAGLEVFSRKAFPRSLFLYHPMLH